MFVLGVTNPKKRNSSLGKIDVRDLGYTLNLDMKCQNRLK